MPELSFGRTNDFIKGVNVSNENDVKKNINNEEKV